MAGYARRHCLYWEETECLNYYGMLSLHEVFKIVGSQLTETDIEVLSFLLNETCTAVHPLDPAGWTVKPYDGDPPDSGVTPSPMLLTAWRRLQSQGSQHPMVQASYKFKNGLELLLELERRGYLSDGNLEPLLQLLRVLTRHDLLPLVSHKRRRTVSPERIERRHGVQHRELLCTSGLRSSYRQAEIPLPSFTQQLRTGFDPLVSGRRKRRKKRGNGWSRRPKKNNKQVHPLPPPAPPQKASCNVRLRVRAEYLEHESALRDGVSSDKQQPLERQFELFSRADSLLRARDLGSIVCDIKFTELGNLEAFWGDYLSGALLEALKGVFITDSLRVAAGSEGIRLLISVDQDDYEEGRRLLRARRMLSSSTGGHKNKH
ncbi:death effector domain-containing 1 isoform X1 [Dunckerocampus dactyliophorus]|uniref:death effector domain-containing 1 isoform X1 n=1 Tax=Dunckerocampus dactyliophorus TaxID=161453 RepID=UPI0024051AC7|nr:death effector domain-containing 1 isoform X1 [Dunckerocampus dactyliophorus]XP_054638597.1 death effector domain-containing 1 isoform X1 [Dunckerocampus dactyliophorus]XP_054638600.1 death effector domain-containing 1 isoform X1 [Dunckerocampus dactyliophorus]